MVSKTYFRKLINGILHESASQYLKINPGLVEKDYWINLVLERLSSSRFRDKVVFKGGTSLSKGYYLIDRFSEVVDLAID